MNRLALYPRQELGEVTSMTCTEFLGRNGNNVFPGLRVQNKGRILKIKGRSFASEMRRNFLNQVGESLGFSIPEG